VELIRLSWTDPPTAPPAPPPTGEAAPLRSLHTASFPALLQELGVSVLVTTYQAGKLVMLRADGDVLNTHFRGFNSPMGLAVQGDRLAIGTALELWEYHNTPAVATKLEPAGKHDACFLPRGSSTTGDIQIHEIAWGMTQESGIRGRESENSSVLTPDSCLLTPNSRPLTPVPCPLPPELWFVNTRFSCLCTSTRDLRYSFVPRW